MCWSTERYQQTNVLVLEHDHGIVEPEVLCYVHKLWETENGISELLEEQNVKLSRRGVVIRQLLPSKR